ncbi:hypothetical protein IMZ11_36740 [Microtetraspora sp. AC03309]|uniref:hypothetical protein n=1 Tax=Microtetraspora sp. AC03309 TaxID=2779376 RepID=UPI001E3AA9B3|nr:hypothetical protein [Microtetraspora sp. AC03309]MCC5581171.1 hypothetical protein [Microtetraspora sp. AC03309]
MRRDRRARPIGPDPVGRRSVSPVIDPVGGDGQQGSGDGDDEVADLRSARMLATAPGWHPGQLMAGFDASTLKCRPSELLVLQP